VRATEKFVAKRVLRGRSIEPLVKSNGVATQAQCCFACCVHTSAVSVSRRLALFPTRAVARVREATPRNSRAVFR